MVEKFNNKSELAVDDLKVSLKYGEAIHDSRRLKEAFNQISSFLRRSLSPGVLVFLTGFSDDKGYLLADALSDTCRFINVGKYLSTQLLEVQRSRRSQKALQLLSEVAASGPCCFYDLEILFDPSMEIDVLIALKTIAKGREIYIDWPGEWKEEEQILTFAEPEDCAYRTYSIDAEIGIVDLSGENYPSLDF
jgi:hypothetical protein